jgi:SCF-associated factor 1
MQMADDKLTFLDLPQDILEIIFLQLHPNSFLSLCSITKAFWQDQHRNPTYWRVTTSATFRIPVSPLLDAKGDRWFWLYKKLRTQTKAFTWGQGTNGALGLGLVPLGLRNVRPPVAHPRLNRPLVRLGNPILRQDDQDEQLVRDRRDHSWPSKMDVPKEVGVIADLQCGGWSTTLLSSRGDLYSVGILDQDEGRAVGQTFDTLTRLDYRSHSPMQSFSAGRKHVLGLDEEGCIWSWDRIDLPAWQICDVTSIKASKVAAGWNVSSAYTKEGIIYWRVPRGISGEDTDQARKPLGSDSLDNETESADSAQEFVKTTTISGTDFRTSQHQEETTHSMGEVLAHIVLEAYIVFITDLAKVFACKIVGENDPRERSFEVTSFTAADRKLKDIQGSFRKFCVFTAEGEVLSGDQDYLDRLYDLRELSRSEQAEDVAALQDEATNVERPRDIAALQHKGVISIAFGDYHFHALHRDGQITSYGHEPQCCGALGLGETSSGARFRGVKFGGRDLWNRDAVLLPIGYNHGREIWFAKSQEAWLARLEEIIRTPDPHPHYHPAFEILNFRQDKQAAYSEWVEREGRAWEEGVENKDGLRSYFAISVAAAGWHSAALVLENDELVEKVREKWLDKEGNYVWEKAGLPRIRLPDGYEFPGSGELLEWRGVMPTVEELGLADQSENTSS